MPVFSYTVLDSNGAKRTGVRESSDMQAVAALLRAENLFILEIREAASRGPRASSGAAVRRRLGGFRSIMPVTRREIIQFFRQMGLMLRSGLTILQGVEFFRDQCGRTRLAKAVERLAERILGGASLSAALGKEGNLFPPLAIKMVATGEVTGEIDVMLERIAAQLEHEAEIRNSLLTSLTYPALVVIVTTGVVTFLVTSVIPKLINMLAARNISPPASTQLLVDITGFLNRNGIWIVAALVSGLAAVIAVRRTKTGRYWTDRVLLSVPVVGHLITLAFVARFGRTSAILLKSGVHILDGLRIFGESVANSAFARQIKRAETEVLKGKPMSNGLRARIIPRLLTALVSTGEVTGTLDSVLDDTGVFFEKKLQREIKWMTTIFEPVMIIIVGGIVGFVYIAFFQVLYQMSAPKHF